MHFLATCTIGNKIVEILLSNGEHFRKQDILDQTCTIHLADEQGQALWSVLLEEDVDKGQRGRKCWQTEFIGTDGEVCPAGSLNSAIILFGVGCGRKASSCTELKRIQSAKCRLPHFSLPPILPFFWVAIFVYYAVLIL